MRLAKYLAHAGVASRRAAEKLIEEGRVSVGGTPVRDPARDVDDGVQVSVDGRVVRGRQSLVVYALHKPVGVLSTARDPQGRRTVLDLVPEQRRLYPVGRLDADSAGLILLTNDGDLAHRLMHPSFEVPKTYRAHVQGGAVAKPALDALRSGVELADGPTAPAKVRQLAPGLLELTIREGRNRQVRRMCESVGHPVSSLLRTRIGQLELGDLPAGGYRRLGRAEIDDLMGEGN